MREVVGKDGIPRFQHQASKASKESCYKNENTTTSDYGPGQLAQGAASDQKPTDADSDPEGNEVGSKKKTGSSEHANS